MTESPRWERESHEDLSAPASQPQDTVEMERLSDGPAPAETDRAAGPERLVDPGELDDPPEYAHAPELASPEADLGLASTDSGPGAGLDPRLAAARDSLAATRRVAAEHLAATAQAAQRRLTAVLQATRERSSTGGESAGALLAIARRRLSDGAETAAGAARRLGRWVAALDRRPEFDAHVGRDPVAELTADAPSADPAGLGGHDSAGRFPVALRGYDRAAVDGHLGEIEAELARLRARRDEPMSITEEIERLGEQTASILVVAHDTAHETRCRAQEQAARAVTEAADDAERITAEAQRRLRELDEETDAVWRERQRLLDDVRDVSTTLATLAEAAVERFPADADELAAGSERRSAAVQHAGASAPAARE